jgi:ketosteroid isomerase-like protein
VDESTKKDLIEIWVDAEKTYLDLAQVILSSNDGKISATSIRCGKSQKHLTAAWIGLFLADDLIPLPDEGRLVAKDSSGNRLLDEPVDVKMIKSLLSPNGPSTKIGVEEEIWALEEAYFANLYKADYEGVLALTHSQFLGWPSDAPQPIDKGGSARFMKQLISQPTPCTFTIERGGIRVLGAVALTQYTIRVSCAAAAAGAKTQTSRITHTWLKEGASWKLLGGMSYDRGGQ